MYGCLVPSSGGKSIPLKRERIYLGRRPEVDPAAPLNSQTALCRLRLESGCWHVDDLTSQTVVRVNGVSGATHRMAPHDELAIGRTRFRLVYPHTSESQANLETIAQSVLLSETVAIPRQPERETNGQTWPQSKPVEGDVLGRLLPVGGGHDYPLLKPRITVGRKSSCDLVIRSPTVSSMHCGLEWTEGHWRVLDLGSRNGIRVEGIRCERAWLMPRGRLTIADHRFQIEYTPQGDPPEPDLHDPSYKRPLMEKVGAGKKIWDEVLARQDEAEPDERQKKRYDLLNDL